MDDSDDEVFMGRIGEKEKKILLKQFRKFANHWDLKCDTDESSLADVKLANDDGIVSNDNIGAAKNKTRDSSSEVMTIDLSISGEELDEDETCVARVPAVDLPMDICIFIENNNKTVKVEVKDESFDSEVQIADIPKGGVTVITNSNVIAENEESDLSSEVIDLSTSTEELVEDLSSEVIVIDLSTSTEELAEDETSDAIVPSMDLPKDIGIFKVKDESFHSKVGLPDVPTDDGIVISNTSVAAENEMRDEFTDLSSEVIVIELITSTEQLAEDETSDAIVPSVHIENHNKAFNVKVKDVSFHSEAGLADVPKNDGIIISNNSVAADNEMRVTAISSEVAATDLSTSGEVVAEGSCPLNTENKALSTKLENTSFIDDIDINKCLQDHNWELENSLGDGMSRLNVSDSEGSETNLNSTLDNVENLLAQGMKYMLTDDNGVDISQYLPDGCDVFDSNKEKSHNEDSNITGLPCLNSSIEYEKRNIDLPNTDMFNSCGVESESEHSETNLNDTLENVENLLSHGMKYMLTDDNGMDVSHLLPDGCNIFDIDKKATHDEDPKLSNSVNDNFIIPSNTKLERPILRTQNKCVSIVRDYINVNPPQFITNVKPKVNLSKVGNIVNTKQMDCVVSSEGSQQSRTPKPVNASVKMNINSPLPAVDYTSTIGLMLKKVPDTPKTRPSPVVTKHLGRIRIPSEFQSNTLVNNDEVSLLLSNPAGRSSTFKKKIKK